MMSDVESKLLNVKEEHEKVLDIMDYFHEKFPFVKTLLEEHGTNHEELLKRICTIATLRNVSVGKLIVLDLIGLVDSFKEQFDELGMCF